MESFFMHTPDGPLPRLFEFAARTFAAGNFDRNAGFRVRFFEDKASVPAILAGTKRSYWTKARHLETNPAAHRSGADIFDMSVRARARERALRRGLAHFVASHGMLLLDVSTLIGVSPPIYIK